MSNVNTMERLMDALEIRATQNNFVEPDKISYSYMTGYMEALLRQLSIRYPEVDKYLAETTKYIEQDIFAHAIGMEHRLLEESN